MSIRIEGVGNLGANPLKKTVTVGDEEKPVVEFDMHFDHVVPDGDGGFKDKDGFWSKIVIWKAGLGDRVERHLSKGAKVFVKGSGQVRAWTDDNGNNHQRFEVTATYVAPDLLCVDCIEFKPRRNQEQ